jgi:hypothetical protein
MATVDCSIIKETISTLLSFPWTVKGFNCRKAKWRISFSAPCRAQMYVSVPLREEVHVNAQALCSACCEVSAGMYFQIICLLLLFKQSCSFFAALQILLSIERKQTKQIPWSESASELHRPSDRLLSAKWLPIFADRGCHVVSVTDPYGRILGFLDRSHYFSIK